MSDHDLPARAAPPREPLDIHTWVLARLDAHIAEMQALRRQLTSRRCSEVRARWYAAAATAMTARYYASEVSRVLREREEPTRQP